MATCPAVGRRIALWADGQPRRTEAALRIHRGRYEFDPKGFEVIEGEPSHRGSSGGVLMLPVTVQFIVAMLAYALNHRMARKAEHLCEENRVLKEALRGRDGQGPIAGCAAASWRRQ